ncbi:hypothetical protein PMI09_00678 [Rhizobium sp. CF122]|uniref:hypothetical protein n=1 Tax=Rhizobium sp. CF122 TaxID=1144312 RepID=UPI000271A028|nr:hypothetical protein [Rhizobium sp. CF122]EJL57973.1 hypothetical protein PMI09_00678 [Rhizobium sp. CF122]
MERTIIPEGGMTPTNLAAALAAMQHSLRTTIEAIPQIDSSQQDWLDQLEANLIREAKGTVADGIAIGEEAAAIRFGIEVLQATLDACRTTLGLASDQT